jgi:hypothetical protein
MRIMNLILAAGLIGSPLAGPACDKVGCHAGAPESLSLVPGGAVEVTEPTPRGPGGFRAPFLRGGPAIGEKGVGFALQGPDGEEVSLAEMAGKNVVIEFGSLTCPVFRGHVDEMKALQSRWADRDDVEFLLIYSREAHPDQPERMPGDTVYSQPTTQAEKDEMARLTREMLGLTVPIAVDTVDARTQRAYGAGPNSVTIVDAEGEVVFRQQWLDPQAVEVALTELTETGEITSEIDERGLLPGGRRGGQRPRRSPQEMMARLDGDGDGVVQLSEIPDERVRTRLGAADTNGDGALTRAELQAWFETRRERWGESRQRKERPRRRTE